MSAHGEQDPKALPPDASQVPWRRLVLIAALALTVFAVGIGWSIFLLRRPGEGYVPGERPLTQEGRPEIGIVDQRMFVLEQRAWKERDAQTQQLHSYGWVDRDAGVVHIPIERAMELVAKEHSK